MGVNQERDHTMKKTSAVITALALAFAGAAFAENGGSGSRHESATPHSAQGDGLLAKTERGLHRIGAKMRQAFHRDSADSHQAKQ